MANSWRQEKGYPANKEVSFDVPKRCPLCGKKNPIKNGKHSRIVYDVKVFRSGIMRRVIKYNCPRCQCKKCDRTFFPPDYQKMLPSKSKYGQSLLGWVMYQHIGLLISQSAITEAFCEIFGYRLPNTAVANLKESAACLYRNTYDNLLLKITQGELIHIDETKVSIKGSNNYVWAVTNMENVVYLYNATRENNMIKERLNDFRGVLVSDFYTAYDSLPCPQQKCLIHLIRDMNDDILKNPFDEELKHIGYEFTRILSPIIETFDKYGLKKHHLNKHKNHVDRFLKKIRDMEYSSDIAKNFQRRFTKYGEKLFTFLHYDGVPWNNNNAEHAIKKFAQLRKALGGSSTAKGIQEYLVLLSICETLRLRNASFFQFLLSGEIDVDLFLISNHKKAA